MEIKPPISSKPPVSADVLSHSIRGIGPLSFPIYSKLPKALWKVLRGTGAYKAMSRVHHLGVLRFLHPSALHTRLDYVFLQGFIAEFLRKNGRHAGLGSSIEIAGETVTGSELIALWALTVNIGHRNGTFATERALHYRVHTNTELKQAVLDGIHEKLRSEALRIIDSEEWFRFHLVCSWMIMSKTSALKDLPWVEVVKTFLSPTTLRLRNWRSLYDQIRKISYVHLDSQCVNPYFQTDLPAVLLSIQSHPASAAGFITPGLPFSDLTAQMSDHLYRNVYLAPEASPYVVQSMEHVASNLDKVINAGAKPPGTRPPDYQDLSMKLLSYSSPDVHDCNYEHVVRFRLGVGPIQSQVSKGDFTLYKEWRAQIQPSAHFKVFAVRPPGSTEAFLDIVANRERELPQGLKWAFEEPLRPIREGHPLEALKVSQPGAYAYLLRVPRAALIDSGLQLLSWIAKRPVRFELRLSPNGHSSSLTIPGAMGSSSKECSGPLTEANKLFPSSRYQEFKGEIASIAAYLDHASRYRGYWVVPYGPVLVRDRVTGDEVAELDGLALLLREKSVTIALVEAKGGNKKSGHEHRTNELRTKLMNIGFDGIGTTSKVEVNKTTSALELRYALSMT